MIGESDFKFLFENIFGNVTYFKKLEFKIKVK